MNCILCKAKAVKNGKQKNGRQRYYCKSCKKSFQRSYYYNAYGNNINYSIYKLLISSVGINNIAKLLQISKTTVIKRIKMLSNQISIPTLKEKHQYYELDEMRIVVGNKQREAWITYAINRYTKQVVNFVVGRRTKCNISKITKSVLQLKPKKVFTDGLVTYKKLIPKGQHNTRKKNTTIIERHNLTLRTDLKRLSRKTICYSKNFEMLESVLKIYFWGKLDSSIVN